MHPNQHISAGGGAGASYPKQISRNHSAINYFGTHPGL